MSRKSFIASMEDLFGEMPPEEQSTGKRPEVRVREAGSEKKDRKKRLGGLDALFQEAFDEGMSRKRTRRKPLPKSGLNSLIRSTVESGKLEVDYESRRRVTFLFEKDKLERLREIAREEKKQLKEVIREIVSGYLEEREGE